LTNDHTAGRRPSASQQIAHFFLRSTSETHPRARPWRATCPPRAWAWQTADYARRRLRVLLADGVGDVFRLQREGLGRASQCEVAREINSFLSGQLAPRPNPRITWWTAWRRESRF